MKPWISGDAPQIITGMAAEAYHAMDGLGSSDIRALAKSPAHFRARKQRPLASPSLMLGSLVHTLVLEPHLFDREYIVRPDGIDGRTKAGKAWLDAVPPGMLTITVEDHEKALAMAASVRAHPAWEDRGDNEASVFWVDAATGMRCRARPDKLVRDGSTVYAFDVKTAREASASAFSRDMAAYGYHIQDAWYSEGCQIATGMPLEAFVFLVVESEYPYLAAAYVIHEEDRQRAADEVQQLRAKWAGCMKADRWPGYQTDEEVVQLLRVPPWGWGKG